MKERKRERERERERQKRSESGKKKHYFFTFFNLILLKKNQWIKQCIKQKDEKENTKIKATSASFAGIFWSAFYFGASQLAWSR